MSERVSTAACICINKYVSANITNMLLRIDNLDIIVLTTFPNNNELCIDNIHIRCNAAIPLSVH